MREFEQWVERIEDGFRLVDLPHGAPELAPRPRSEMERPEYAETTPRESPRPTPPRSTEGTRPSLRESERQQAGSSPQRTPGSESPAPNPAPRQQAAAPSSASSTAQNFPVGVKVVGKPGFVYSPFDSDKKLVDVVGVPSGTKVKCPYTIKIFLVP